MTVTRIGSNSKYATGWEQAFGGRPAEAKAGKSGGEKTGGSSTGKDKGKGKGDKPKDKKSKK